jgi:hypothetical protein
LWLSCPDTLEATFIIAFSAIRIWPLSMLRRQIKENHFSARLAIFILCSDNGEIDRFHLQAWERTKMEYVKFVAISWWIVAPLYGD